MHRGGVSGCGEGVGDGDKLQLFSCQLVSFIQSYSKVKHGKTNF